MRIQIPILTQTKLLSLDIIKIDTVWMLKHLDRSA